MTSRQATDKKVFLNKQRLDSTIRFDNNRTDALKTDINLFLTITNCQIVCSRSQLTHRIIYKFMCLSPY